jgi:hypothetical protein
MADLTGRRPAALAPSSMEGGNLTQPDAARLTMTAPGSPPVTLMPAMDESSHMPQPELGADVPAARPKSTPPGRARGKGTWADVTHSRLLAGPDVTEAPPWPR